MTAWLGRLLDSTGVDGLPWAALDELAFAARGGRDRLRAARALLRLLGLASLALALAGPVRTRPPERADLPGLDLLLVLDLSDSMRALDTEVGGRAQTRLLQRQS